MADIAIIGAGPAGISAALTARARGKDVLVVSNNPQHSALAKAERIDNYPGMVGMSGQEIVTHLIGELEKLDIAITEGRVISVLSFGDEFMLSIGADIAQAKAVIVTIGSARAKEYPGEKELLGRGVSYCATCDGMLYRGKNVCVIGSSEESQLEANFLADIGCNVTFVSPTPAEMLKPDISYHEGRVVEVVGSDKVEAVRLADGEITCDGAFILRPSIAPASLIDGLELDGAFIKVDAGMATNIPGVFAAGDCVGKPLQISKAVGQGQIAAFSAVDYIEKK